MLAASNKKSRGIGVGALLMFALIAFHFFFIFSMSAFLAAAACFGSIGYFFVSRRNHRNRKKEALYGLILLVVTPGILIPFAIAQIPDIGFYLVAEDVLNKGSNWDDKIGFLALGSSLYTRFVPTFGDIPAASHNLVLSTYLKYGYILSLPLIGYCWALMKNAFAGLPFAILAGTAITILAHMLVVPPQFFYPSGAMWILMAVGVAFHARRTESNRAVIPSASVTPLRGKVEPSR